MARSPSPPQPRCWCARQAIAGFAGRGRSRLFRTEDEGRRTNVRLPSFVLRPSYLVTVLAKLRLVQPAIHSTSADQLVMRALLADAALGHNNNAIGIFDRGKPVRDN